MKHTIDAENKVLGRVANEAARLLLGKDSPAFQKNIVAGNVVEVINAGKMKMPEEKMMAEKYASHSGYPGSQKLISRKEVVEKKGVEALVRRAVYKMLPKNRLQDIRIKTLKVVK
ncbi:MAG: 50S ribosomal protein L13 [Candidatus Taylorbacteria bacterium RIFCSPLOWO2_02_FULL_43_11]|uniref:50S ribosomal protein L13 n=1 Tax=Candidatus Taylorbacteria bacterium RIFCSPHIGHO2_02_FULL_43_32b TaxID=1802306 RepID=A0A1G2MEB8_9BACT|nr:MAG: 50S ribosomal protein L13 [Candidatus Taylorbacteria bacterium RIFCSPHIGHO2_01_FULL_43_47]OHA22255.1 MAG: 50S ribosomal protein L13 [Candidatus Taylorbacteria bacterium RIFCSPHIGHO2_02_FULL_43_32b]OHA29610.1 MAG: 50S ribosomal protein L13 [Candidatus Taylorbacteria bacterium RIFCSPLOWO2_01_FULL_43_44]OHA36140.1 MAG: 50S ribosomal protein L13 [Candidatus Taylorbacteria bacterium RIFCSPLOWO2_02_FULL_43_11]